MRLVKEIDRTARRHHKCHICRQDIQPKTRYKLIKSAEFKGPWSNRTIKNKEYKICLDCYHHINERSQENGKN